MDSYVLYVVIDRYRHGLLNYFRESGLNVSNIYTNIANARGAILVQQKKSRIVIIDTGAGKFSAVPVRKDLIDLIGISDDSNKISIFYTDSVIKTDALKGLGKRKGINWINYNGIASVVATLLQYKERYELDDYHDHPDEMPTEDKIYSLRGVVNHSIQLDTNRITDIFFSNPDIIGNLTSEDNAKGIIE